MTIAINLVESGLGIEIIATGCVTGAEIIEAHQKIYNTDNLKRQKYQIIDRTNCTQYLVSNEEIKQIAEIDKNASLFNPDIIIVIISPNDLQFGMSRVWEAYVGQSTFTTRVFRDRVSAENWLKKQLA